MYSEMDRPIFVKLVLLISFNSAALASQVRFVVPYLDYEEPSIPQSEIVTIIEWKHSKDDFIITTDEISYSGEIVPNLRQTTSDDFTIRMNTLMNSRQHEYFLSLESAERRIQRFKEAIFAYMDASIQEEDINAMLKSIEEAINQTQEFCTSAQSHLQDIRDNGVLAE